MRTQQRIVYRGLYGPRPAALIPSGLLWRQRLASWTTVLLRRLSVVGCERLIEPGAAVEQVPADGQQLQFRPIIPAQALRGYRLTVMDTTSGCTDLFTLSYEAECGRSFSVSQRPKWLPLSEELRLSGMPATSVRCDSVRFFVVHGVYIGEPIDHAYSARSRRSVAVEVGDLIVELREVRGRGPGLRGLMEMAKQFASARFQDDATADIQARSFPYQHASHEGGVQNG